MNEWFYARGGQQSGPVTLEQLQQLARSGGLDPAKDLVWKSSMKDWTPAGQVPGIFGAVPSPAPSTVPGPVAASPSDPSNPYAAPQSTWIEPQASAATGALPEIIPGSEPIDAVACVKRGFDLTKRQFGNIVLVVLVYIGVIIGMATVFSIIQGVVGLAFSRGSAAGTSGSFNGSMVAMIVICQLVNLAVSLFLALGITRIGLNLVSGKPVNVGMMFGEGRKLLRVLGATILFLLMVFVGMLFLFVPGVYLALRYGQYLMAIVDRDLGIMDAFSYSSTITTNNRLNLFVLHLLLMAVAIAGACACGVGLIFAAPVVWLAIIVAYRWMQHGHRAVLDQPGTTTPLLAGN